MDIQILHFYPDLMSLYGSYANVTVLKAYLESLGNTVRVCAVRPGDDAAVGGADFLFMGAGTERSQLAALADFSRYGDAVRAAAAAGCAMLFAGTAMELLGASITTQDGTLHPGIALAPFTSVQGNRRIVGDVYGHTALYPDAVVGFMNKCSVLSGVETPLLTALDMGPGNGGGPGEGFCQNNVLASQLTGPLLVKNPRLLVHVAQAIYARRGGLFPEAHPVWPEAEAGYATTAEQLRLRSGQEGAHA